LIGDKAGCDAMSGLTRSLQPTYDPHDYSTVTQDGELIDASNRQRVARTRLNSTLCPKIIWKLINTHALVVVIKRFMKSHRGHMKFVECVDGRMILFNLKMPVYEGGANGESLRDAQYNFLKDHEDDGNSFGYKKDKNWTILSPPKEKISTNKMKTNFIVNKNGVISKN